MPDAPRPNHPHVYRAFRVNREGRILSAAVVIEATDDEDAVVQARRLVDHTGVELWDRARRVVWLPPVDGDGTG